MIKVNNFIRMLQLIHLVFCLLLCLFVFVALLLNYEEFTYDFEGDQFQRRILKIVIGFLVGIAGAHLIPYVFFWRRIKKKYGAKKIKLFFTGSIWQWSLLTFLGLCLTVVFFIYPNVLIFGFFIILFIVLMAKRPTHFRLLDKTKLTNTDISGSGKVELT